MSEKMNDLVILMKAHATTGIFTGDKFSFLTTYYKRANQSHIPSGTHLIFTRDEGYHSSGWWKNPDYERCFHLSISFHHFQKNEWLPFNDKLAFQWCKLFFGQHINLIWEEPSEGGKPIKHYRVFCNQAWEPIKPRKEVYTKEFTPSGWKSWSDVKDSENKGLGNPNVSIDTK